MYFITIVRPFVQRICCTSVPTISPSSYVGASTSLRNTIFPCKLIIISRLVLAVQYFIDACESLRQCHFLNNSLILLTSKGVSLLSPWKSARNASRPIKKHKFLLYKQLIYIGRAQMHLNAFYVSVCYACVCV